MKFLTDMLEGCRETFSIMKYGETLNDMLELRDLFPKDINGRNSFLELTHPPFRGSCYLWPTYPFF